MAEGIAKRKNSLIPWNNSIETGTRVFSQAEEYLIYNPSKMTFNQLEIPSATAAPRLSKPDLNIKTQLIGTCKQRLTQAHPSMGMIKLCVWKNLISG